MALTKDSPAFSLEHQFSEYARRVKLDQAKVSRTQWIETRRAFFGAAAQILFMFRDDLSELSEDDGVEVLERMKNEAAAFWATQNNRQN